MPPGLPNGLAASWMLPALGSPVFGHCFTLDCHNCHREAVGLSPSLTVSLLILGLVGGRGGSHVWSVALLQAPMGWDDNAPPLPPLGRNCSRPG